MNRITLNNIAIDELQLLIRNASIAYSSMTESELIAAAEDKDKILAKKVARHIQPQLEKMQNASGFKKAFLLLKYFFFENKKAKCTIPREALESFARTILPDIIAFFETEEGNRQYEEWLKEEERKEDQMNKKIK